jgi:hypothetical protein
MGCSSSLSDTGPAGHSECIFRFACLGRNKKVVILRRDAPRYSWWRLASWTECNQLCRESLHMLNLKDKSLPRKRCWNCDEIIYGSLSYREYSWRTWFRKLVMSFLIASNLVCPYLTPLWNFHKLTKYVHKAVIMFVAQGIAFNGSLCGFVWNSWYALFLWSYPSS